MKEWLSIAEAAVIAGKEPRTIYRWVQSGRLASRVAQDGTTEVAATEVLKVEAATKRGRPRGSVSTTALTRRNLP